MTLGGSNRWCSPRQSTGAPRTLPRPGIDAASRPAAIDEGALKRRSAPKAAAPSDCALALAEAKAMRVSRVTRRRSCIGADQMLDCGGAGSTSRAISPTARGAAPRAARPGHELVSAVAVVRDGDAAVAPCRARAPRRCARSATLSSTLTSRRWAIGCAETVGGYRLEGLGAQLFARIEGDYFAILGLPLLPLLDFLREPRRAGAMTLSGAAKLAGVMGWPVAHSRSPALHGFWLAEHGIDGAYLPLPVRPENLRRALAGAAAPAASPAATSPSRTRRRRSRSSTRSTPRRAAPAPSTRS